MYLEDMNTMTAQNAAHRTDVAWIKSNGKQDAQ